MRITTKSAVIIAAMALLATSLLIWIRIIPQVKLPEQKFETVPTAHRSEIGPIGNLGPHQVVALGTLWQQLADIDALESDEFKESAWNTVAGWLHEYIKANRDLGTLAADPFLCIPEREKTELDAARQALEKEGPKNFKIRLSLMESLRVLHSASPALAVAAEGWKQGSPPRTLEACTNAVVEALRTHHLMRQRIAKLRLLTKEQEWLLKLVSLDRGQLNRLVDAIDPLGGPNALANLNDPEVAKVLLEKRKQVSKNARELEPRLREIGETLRDGFERNARQLTSAERTYREIASTQVIDLPEESRDGGRPFVRARLTLPNQAEYKGADTLLAAQLFLAWPVSKDTVKLQPGLAMFEEVSLGLEVSGVRLRFDDTTGKVIGARAEPVQLRANIKLADPVALRRALVRLGVPDIFQLSRLEAFTNPEFTIIRIRFEAELPSLGVKTASLFEVTIDLLKAKVVADPLDPSNWLTEGEYFADRLQKEISGALADKTFALGGVMLKNFQLGGRWATGQVVLTATAVLPGMPEDLPPWVLRLDYVPLTPGRAASLKIADTPVPAALVDAISLKAKNKLISELRPLIPDEPKLPLGLEEIERYFQVTDLKFNPEVAKITGRVVITTKVNNSDLSLSVPFSAGLSDGSVTVAADELLKQLVKVARDLLEDIAKRRVGDAVAQLEGELTGKTIDVLGAKFTLTIAKYESATSSFLVEGTLSLGEQTITFTGLRLCSVKIEGDKVVAPKLDFTGVKVRPGLAEYVSKMVGLDSKFLRLSQERWLGDGVEFDLTLNLQESGMEIPIGLIRLGTKQFEANLKLDEQRVLQAAAKWVGEQVDLKIPDIGPVKNIKPDLTRLKIEHGQLEFWVSVDCDLDQGITLPLKIRLSPSLKVENGDISGIFGKLKEMIGAQLGITDSLRLEKIVPLEFPNNPIGIQFDLKIGVFGEVGITLPGIRILKGRTVLPQRASIQIPLTIPIPPALAIVKPEIGFSLGANDPKASLIEVGGNLTFLSEGIDKIIKVRCRMSLNVKDLKSLSVDLVGTLILVEYFPVFEVTGKAELAKGRLSLDARTVGLIDKLIQIRGKHRIEGPEFLATQYGSLAVLGIDLAATDIVIDAKKPEVRASAQAQIPICSVLMKVTGSPNLKKFRGSASASFSTCGIGVSAELVVDPGKAELKFGIMGITVRIITPSVLQITPGLVAEIVQRLLDIDPKWPPKSLEDVTVNLLKDNGDPVEGDPVVGEGDKLPPPPPGGQGDKEKVTPPPSSPEQNAANPSGSPPSGGSPKVPTTVAQSGNQPGSIQPTPTPVQGGGELPRTVYAYKPGPNLLEFVEDPNKAQNPGLFVDLVKSGDGKSKWIGWYAFSKAVKEEIWDNHLIKSDVILIDEFWTRVVDKDGRQTSLPNRWGQQSDWMHVFVTINSKRQVFVVELNPAQGRQRVRQVNVPWKDINPQLVEGEEASWWDRLRNWFQNNKQDLLLPGDIAMVREYIQLTLVVGGPQLESISRQPEEKGVAYDLSRPEGFFYKIKTLNQPKASLAFCERKTGWIPFVAPPGTDLYELMNDYPTNPLAKNIVLLYCGATGHHISMLWRGTSEALFLSTKYLPGAGPERYLWRVDGASIRRVSVSKANLPFSAVAATHWPAGDPFGKSLSDLINGHDWNEVALAERTDGSRAVGLGWQLDKADWGLILLTERRPPGAAPQVETIGQKTNGAAIETKYSGEKGWTSNSRVKSAAPYFTLDSIVSRRWLIDVLLSDREVWDRYFESNPRGLLTK